MKLFIFLITLILYLSITNSALYNDLKNDFLTVLRKRVPDEKQGQMRNFIDKNFYFRNEKKKKDQVDIAEAKKKAKAVLRARKDVGAEDQMALDPTFGKKIVYDTKTKQQFEMDPVLNFRRHKKDDSSDTSSSSSLELKDWKEEWKEVWLEKKIEALNATTPRGDTVNMAAARPWAVPCGDPNQHDMPWGSCMLSMECEPEFRIFRGDHFCGRTRFVCCAIQLTSYDMYQGFDVSFDATSFETDSEERRNRDKNSKERRKGRKRKARRKRRRKREKRKKKIRTKIKKIVKEIKKILNRSFKNGTRARKKKTKKLKKFIKALKKKYKKDRMSVRDIHEMELIKIDAALMKKIGQIMMMNKNFIRNSTFRDIIVNGTITKKAARLLVQAYPDLAEAMPLRKSGGGEVGSSEEKLDYDIEYGLLYY